MGGAWECSGPGRRKLLIVLRLTSHLHMLLLLPNTTGTEALDVYSNGEKNPECSKSQNKWWVFHFLLCFHKVLIFMVKLGLFPQLSFSAIIHRTQVCGLDTQNTLHNLHVGRSFSPAAVKEQIVWAKISQICTHLITGENEFWAWWTPPQPPHPTTPEKKQIKKQPKTQDIIGDVIIKNNKWG